MENYVKKTPRNFFSQYNQPKQSYSDVYIIPQYTEITSRIQVDISSFGLKIPVLSSNMDTISELDMSLAMFKSGGAGCVHRFMSIEDNVAIFRTLKQSGADKTTFMSVGVNEDSKERAKALFSEGAEKFIIDIAHGHSIMLKKMLTWMRKEFKGTIHIMAGNVATAKAVIDLENWGADSIKVGIGPGCFAAGTRILMSNGFYKNIEEIKEGEFVINKNGLPVKVLKSFCTGIKKVIKLRTNHFYQSTYVTPDHQYWIGDLGTNNNTIHSTGYKKVLDKLSKTSPKQSKYKWTNIDNKTKKFVLLLPNKINFDMPKTFSIDLSRKYGNYKSGFKLKKYINLTPNYELGYIFGTFLGNGNVRTPKNEPQESNSVCWTFGANELEIAEKLSYSVEKIFNKKPSIKLSKKKNTYIVSFYEKPFADFLSSFEKKAQKHLPEHLLISNKEYMQGLFDGLIDSDGNISQSKTTYGVKSFSNTSSKLIELFNILNFILNNHFPLNEKTKSTIDKLKNINIENCNSSFKTKELKNYKNRSTKDYQIVKILEKETQEIELPVYDLEVDCETHSFIANNSIVHNSVCLTKNVTGVTYPIFSCVSECCEVANVPIIADGSVKEIGDCSKAIGAGASAVMIGSMFSGCDETPFLSKALKDIEILKRSGKYSFEKEQQILENALFYRGMASFDSMIKVKDPNKEILPTPEGKVTKVERKGSVVDIMNNIAGGMRSSYSYCNTKTTKEFQEKVEFGLRMHL